MMLKEFLSEEPSDIERREVTGRGSPEFGAFDRQQSM